MTDTGAAISSYFSIARTPRHSATPAVSDIYLGKNAIDGIASAADELASELKELNVSKGDAIKLLTGVEELCRRKGTYITKQEHRVCVLRQLIKEFADNGGVLGTKDRSAVMFTVLNGAVAQSLFDEFKDFPVPAHLLKNAMLSNPADPQSRLRRVSYAARWIRDEIEKPGSRFSGCPASVFSRLVLSQDPHAEYRRMAAKIDRLFHQCRAYGSEFHCFRHVPEVFATIIFNDLVPEAYLRPLMQRAQEAMGEPCFAGCEFADMPEFFIRFALRNKMPEVHLADTQKTMRRLTNECKRPGSKLANYKNDPFALKFAAINHASRAEAFLAKGDGLYRLLLNASDAPYSQLALYSPVTLKRAALLYSSDHRLPIQELLSESMAIEGAFPHRPVVPMERGVTAYQLRN